MSWVPAEKVLATVHQQRQVLANQEARVATFGHYHVTERDKLEAEKSQAWHDLGLAVLPRLDQAAIAQAAQAVGLVGLPSENIPGQLEARRAWLSGRLTQILHDPDYVNRELLRHPRTGSLTTAIAQNEEYRRPVAAVITTCEAHPRFERLLSSGLGTTEFSAPWWRYSYWQDRSAADALVAKFPGRGSFDEVRAEYTRSKETVSVFDAEIAKLRAQVATGEALDREYATLYDEHQHLDAQGLDYTRKRIIDHLLGSDAGLVSQRLRAAPATAGLLMLFLRASGIAAKISYLDGIQHKELGAMRQDLSVQRGKLDSIEARTRKRWAPMPGDKFEKLREDRQPRYNKQWDRFGKTYTTVYSYDRWDRGRYYDDFLWWDLMTRGRYDGSYMSDISDYHRNHPDYLYDPDWKGRAAMQRDADDAEEESSRAAAIAIANDRADEIDDPQRTDAS